MSVVPSLLIVAALVSQGPEPGGPCRPITPTEVQRRLPFANAIATGPFAMRTLAGQNSCEFSRPGEGRCMLFDPELVHVTLEGEHVWFEVPDGRGARIDVSEGEVSCTVTRIVRTD